MNNQLVSVTERYMEIDGKTFMESSLEPGVWREVTVIFFNCWKVEAWP